MAEVKRQVYRASGAYDLNQGRFRKLLVCVDVRQVDYGLGFNHAANQRSFERNDWVT